MTALDLIKCLREAAKLSATKRGGRGGGVGGKGLATKKKYRFYKLFLFCSQSKIKHILFKGFYWGRGVISLVTEIQNDV